MLLYIPIASYIAHAHLALSKTRPTTHPVSIAPVFLVSKEIKYTRRKQWHHPARTRMGIGQALSQEALGGQKQLSAPAIPQVPWFTSRTPSLPHLQVWTLFLSFSIPALHPPLLVKNILELERPYLLWLKRGDVKVRAFSLFWRQSWYWPPSKPVSLSHFLHDLTKHRDLGPLTRLSYKHRKKPNLLPESPGLARQGTDLEITRLWVHFTDKQHSSTAHMALELNAWPRLPESMAVWDYPDLRSYHKHQY